VEAAATVSAQNPGYFTALEVFEDKSSERILSSVRWRSLTSEVTQKEGGGAEISS
jgi:hypothetical protein